MQLQTFRDDQPQSGDDIAARQERFPTSPDHCVQPGYQLGRVGAAARLGNFVFALAAVRAAEKNS